MKPESLLADTLRDWSREAEVPHDLADRALRGRTRHRLRRTASAAILTAAVVAAGVVVPQLVRDQRAVTTTAGPSDEIRISVAPSEPAETDVRTDTENSPPVRLIAAGRVAVSAYTIVRAEKLPDEMVHYRYTWYLYDPAAGTYEKTPWAKLDVAPGLKYAAVLEDALPVRRVGIVDTSTRAIVKWIGLDHPVADVAWSPDGTRLLTTAYDRDPDVRLDYTAEGRHEPASPSRSGFHLVDVNSGAAEFHAQPEPRTENMCPSDSDLGPFHWTDDGALIWDSTCTTPSKTFYDLQGAPHDPPNGWIHPWMSSEEAGISPDGRLYADGGAPPGPQTRVRNVETGEIAGTQTMLQLLAWADDEHLIGLGCAGKCEDEFHSGLALVGVDGEPVTRLSADQKNSDSPGSWRPIFTRR
ncbi:hypothetical protein [Sphaerisporangium corydalis]|uniref:WD40 repeat domain-containing protein n=1 Tax=Sphaerisporangium corydalis TaxID=1441875 RepID=A0ABV9ECG8_9ACTN|nr:hypothetical protein [Sphaerisporangium corydalis]